MEFREPGANPTKHAVAVTLSPTTARVKLVDTFFVDKRGPLNGEFTLTCAKSVIPQSIMLRLQAGRYTSDGVDYKYHAGQLALEHRKTVTLGKNATEYELLSASTAPNGLFTVQVKAPSGEIYYFSNLETLKVTEEKLYRQLVQFPSDEFVGLDAIVVYDVRCSTRPVHHIYLENRRVHTVLHVQNAENEILKNVNWLNYCEHGPEYSRDKESSREESALMATPRGSVSVEEAAALLNLDTVPLAARSRSQPTMDLGSGVIALEPRALPSTVALSYALQVSVPAEPTAGPQRPTPVLALSTDEMPMLGRTVLYGVGGQFLTESDAQDRVAKTITTRFRPYSSEVLLTVRTAFLDHADEKRLGWPMCTLEISGIVTNDSKAIVPEIVLVLPATFYWAGDTCDILPENRVVKLAPRNPGSWPYSIHRPYTVRLPRQHHR